MSRPLEHDYMGGLSELPSLPMQAGVEKSDLQKNHPTPTPVKPSSASAHPCERRSKDLDLNLNLTLEATELRLGLPGSDPPERDSADESAVVEGRVLKNFAVAGAKRGFSDAIDLRSEKWVLANDVGSESAGGGKAGCGGVGNGGLFSPKAVGARGEALNGSASGNRPAAPKDVGTETEKKAQSSAHASKAQVVGWPPIRSFRKNTMASSKNTEKVEPNLDAGCLYVKVSMDGAPYLRKIDLKIYSSYAELSSALEKMFSGFTIGKYGYHGVPGRDGLSESRLMDLLRCSEYVLTYEDKDGDWMLVGDVPWEMFASSCRKLRITMSSEAIGLAPRAKDKCKSQD